jgi:hypothetical protein
MLRNILTCAILLYVLAMPCIASAKTTGYLPEQGQLFEKALAQTGLSPEDVRIGQTDLNLFGGEKYKIKLVSFMTDNPWKISAYTRSFTNQLITNSGNLSTMVTAAHARLDNGVRLGLTGDPLEAQRKRIEELGDNALAVALGELNGVKPETYTDSGYYAAQYNILPKEIKQAAALLLFTLPQVARYRDLGLVQPMLQLGLDPQTVYTAVLNWVVSTFAEEDGMTGNETVDDLQQVLLIESLLDHVDWNLINTGAALQALASQEAQKLLTAEGADPLGAPFRFEVPTALGTIVLSGGAGDTYPPGDYLLIIDSGGADTYDSCAGTGDFAHPISVCLDLAGDDIYNNSDDTRPAFGAGIFGYGLLLDAKGDDRYSTTYAGLGCGIFGTGVVFDQDGDDRYTAYGNSEASAAFGAGLLIDLAGDDYYGVYKYGQGYGYTRGAGLLVDVAGNDLYDAKMEDHFNGGLYGANHHVHFCQGSAFGRRADYVDGHSWAGGLGLILDGAGDDKYTGDCYVQGNSYWYALGMCVDKGGNDVYRCGQYSQASAPHFSIGVLQDDAGDDRYIVGIRQSMGHGRDWSIAWFEDAAGNDWYQGARTTLGTSHINSLSFFWDRHGDDVYIGKGPTFGESEIEASGSVRDWLLTLGMFVDGGGKDRYYMLPGDESYEASNTFTGEITDLSTLTPLDFAGDGKMWVKTQPTDAAPGFNGVGLDAE